MKNKFYLLWATGIVLSSVGMKAQNVVTDHEGNEYEVARLADGRNWMMEGLRVKTDRQGNPITYYWNDHNGSQTEEAAAYRYGYAYTVETLFGAPAQKDPDFSNRAQGLCPDGYYVPEWWHDDNPAAEGDWQRLIRAYNGLPAWWSETANWIDFMHALRISFGDGTITETGSADGDPGKFTLNANNQMVITGWSHLHSSGPVSWDRLMWLNLSTGDPVGTSGGYEYAGLGATAAYCRCVENLKVGVSFEDFTDMSVVVRLSDTLKWNSYDVRDPFTKICAENFYIENAVTKEPVEILGVEPSADIKSFQIFGEFDPSQVYELKIYDARLRDKKIPFGGYTFNEGKNLYFPKTPDGINPLESADLEVSVVDGVLHIRVDRPLNVRIFDTLGTARLTIKNLEGLSYINISDLTTGVYLLQFYEDNSSYTLVRKFFN